MHGDAALAPVVGGDLTANEPDQEREEEKRQSQVEIDRQRKRQEQHKLDRLAEDHS